MIIFSLLRKTQNAKRKTQNVKRLLKAMILGEGDGGQVLPGCLDMVTRRDYLKITEKNADKYLAEAKIRKNKLTFFLDMTL